jgi:hypothetical protein
MDYRLEGGEVLVRWGRRLVAIFRYWLYYNIKIQKECR